MRKVLKSIDDLGLTLGWLAVIACLFLVLAELIARPLGTSILISVEYSRFLMAALIFLPLGYVTREKRHIRTDFFVQMLSEKTQIRLNYGVSLMLTLAYVIVLLWMMGDFAWTSYVDHTRSEGYSQILLAIPQSVIVIGLCLMLLRLIAVVLAGPEDMTEKAEE